MTIASSRSSCSSISLYRRRERFVCLQYPRLSISRAASQGKSHEYLNRRRSRTDPGPAARSYDQERRVVPVSPGYADGLTGLRSIHKADGQYHYRIQRSLQVKLNEMGWADQVLSHAKGERAVPTDCAGARNRVLITRAISWHFCQKRPAQRTP
jgi:hypothetical protein